ncbi:uncharacterized oxidoreductase MexAM1_META1p0182-like isoform X1 [Haliotis asinina]|uniref:uncharacterized oxidoreductase MexAM1_META1p0182-like isoform X1 n=1 Tax=Haliotis asinina TaxID=109174 RepID=UPI003532768C
MALRGKVAIITGASSGIGAGIAVAFAKEGANLSLTGRKQKNLEEVVKDCKKAGCQDVLTNVGDITQDAFRRTLVDTTKKKFGKIDILVNNAGILLMNPLISVTKEEYDTTMAVNLEGPLFLTQLVAPHLIETKGNVVNNSSCITTMTIPKDGLYTMSKAALDIFTRYLAHELVSHGVRVNSINPGYVPSQLGSEVMTDELQQSLINATPIGRAATPEEVGHIVVFLASDKAAFVTGECFKADGGLSMTTPALA